MPPGLNNDAELWNAICNDDVTAFTELFNRYWQKLYYASYKYTHDRELSEEIVHDVFLSVWTRRAELDIQIIENFLLKAVRYQIYNHSRAAKLAVVYTDTNVYEEYASENNKGEENIKEQDLKNELYKHLNLLPQRCQTIFKMSKLDRLTNQEIAVQLGISKRSVENQLALALKHLKIVLKNAVLILFLLFFTR
jgi:RNA polymerase sigma-70 factor (family 1)